MTQLTPNEVLLLASSTGVGVLMMRAGVQKKMLEWRHHERICAGCGKRLNRPVCSCASPS